MKKIIVLLIIGIIFSYCPTQGQTTSKTNQTTNQTTDQTTDQTVSVKVSDLTPEQLLKIKTDAESQTLNERIETFGKWAGVGKEIGTGIRDALLAVVEVADKFGKTRVGTFTMIMVAWKIVGIDIMKIFIGIVFAVVMTTFIFINYKRNFITRKITTSNNGWQFWLPKTYEIVQPKEYEGVEVVKILYIALLVATYGITYAIMF